MQLLGKAELLAALHALDEELERANVRAEIFIVDGAAMAIAYDARRSTSDVDAVFAPSQEVRKAALRVAERMNLDSDWLNDGAKAFMPGEDPERVGVYEGSFLSVAAASPRFLLAMKLMASRVSATKTTFAHSMNSADSPLLKKALTFSLVSTQNVSSCLVFNFFFKRCIPRTTTIPDPLIVNRISHQKVHRTPIAHNHYEEGAVRKMRKLFASSPVETPFGGAQLFNGMNSHPSLERVKPWC